MLRSLLPVLLAVGCAGGGTAYVVDSGPPAPRAEVVTYRPGHVWVQGHWERQGRRWAWTPGRYERERPSHVWISGHWERRGGRHVWVEGEWRRRGQVVIRDDR